MYINAASASAENDSTKYLAKRKVNVDLPASPILPRFEGVPAASSPGSMPPAGTAPAPNGFSPNGFRGVRVG